MWGWYRLSLFDFSCGGIFVIRFWDIKVYKINDCFVSWLINIICGNVVYGNVEKENYFFIRDIYV